MKQLEAVEAMGLLLHDRSLRERFAEDRDMVICELGVVSSQVRCIQELNLEQLEIQAASLLGKRCSEVAQLIPETWSRLGSQGRPVFFDYAEQSTWPQGHRRHLIDAARFCQFLQRMKSAAYLRSEHQWVEFLADNRFLAVGWMRDLVVRGRQRWAMQVCFRRGGLPQRRAVYLRGIASRNASRLTDVSS